MSASEAAQSKAAAAAASAASAPSTPVTAAAAAASTAPNSAPKDGRIYACGNVAGADRVKWAPLADKFIDNINHSVFPNPPSMPDTSVRFTEVKDEHTLSAALESSPNAGGLWVGGLGLVPERSIASGVVSFSVGISYVIAALSTGALEFVFS